MADGAPSADSLVALAAEYRDDGTQEHAWRLGRTCVLLALDLGLPAREVELLRRAAPVHDIGKIGIPDSILLKPGKLTEEEFERIKTHTTVGAEILSGSRSPLLRMAEQIAISHHERWGGSGYPCALSAAHVQPSCSYHERWDGSGYPCGLSGEQIPLPGRVVAVADVFDALTHQRPYKSAWEVKEAVAEIFHHSGRHFDPDVMTAFLRLDHPTLLSGAKEWDPPQPRQSPAHTHTQRPARTQVTARRGLPASQENAEAIAATCASKSASATPRPRARRAPTRRPDADAR